MTKFIVTRTIQPVDPVTTQNKGVPTSEFVSRHDSRDDAIRAANTEPGEALVRVEHAAEIIYSNDRPPLRWPHQKARP